ncbi:MAG: apolipoprotein N-acyltransferase [Bacteriovoracaceae bacterium]|nr:apolipoprotein N-acyltransferase [Bacteriovoracaceae bacterium]
MIKILKFIFPLIGGVFYSTGFPTDLYYTSLFGPIIGLSLLFCSIDILRSRTAIKSDLIKFLLFFCGATFAGYYWIPYTIAEFGGISSPFNFLMGGLFSLIILPQYWVFFIALFILKKNNIEIKSHRMSSFLLAALLTIIDIVIPQQFPSQPGHAWLALGQYLSLATIFGAQLYSFLSYWFVFSIVKLVARRRFDILPALAITITLVISLLTPIEYKSDSSLRVRMVQANISNNLKISAEKQFKKSGMTVQGTYRKLSLAPGIENIDLIVWPETAYPRIISSAGMQEYRDSIPSVIRQTVEQGGADLFFGGYDHKNNSRNYYSFENQYNAAFFVGNNNQGEARLKNFYHKSRLIPFGETLPLGPLNKYIGRYIQNISYFATGERFPLFKVKDKGFIAAICYEVLSYSFFRDYLNRLDEFPHFAVNISNDSWYGKSIEPFQHLYLTRWRAVEFGLPIVRMTNTGISSIIYPDGTESRRSKLFNEEVIDLELKLRKGQATLFQRFGILNLFGLWTILGVLIWAIARKQIPPSKDREDG